MAFASGVVDLKILPSSRQACLGTSTSAAMETPTRRFAPTSPFQGEVQQAARSRHEVQAPDARLALPPLKGGGIGWGSYGELAPMGLTLDGTEACVGHPTNGSRRGPAPCYELRPFGFGSLETGPPVLRQRAEPVQQQNTVPDTAPEHDVEHDDIMYPSAVPFVLAHLTCLAAIWTGVTWQDLVICAVLYLGRIFAAGAGYHRYFARRAYATSRARRRRPGPAR